MKNYYFLSSLPRAGNTLLGALLNKTTKVAMTANSILPDVLFNLSNLKKGEVYRNFPDEKSYKDMTNNLIKSYFFNWKADNIIIRGPWGTPGNLELLQPIIPKPKFIILHRPLEECVASVVNLIKPKEVELFVANALEPLGFFGHNLMSTKNIIKNNHEHIVIYYKDLVNNTEKELKKIHKFINIPYNKIDINIKEPFKSNNTTYDDRIIGHDFHKLNLGKPKATKYNIKKLLPKELIEYCKEEDVL